MILLFLYVKQIVFICKWLWTTLSCSHSAHSDGIAGHVITFNHLPFTSPLSPHSGVRTNLLSFESSADMWQQLWASLSISLWKTGYGIVYQVSSCLSALCKLHYSLSYVWETISVPCFLHCYLLVVPVEMGLRSGILSSSQGLLDKEPYIPLCAWKIRAPQDRENVTKSLCDHLPILSLGWIYCSEGETKTTQHPSLSDEVIELNSPTPNLSKPPKAKLWLMFAWTIKALSFVCDSIIWVVCFWRVYLCSDRQ